MAATAQWYEDNGAATGNPARGTTRSLASNVDWKSIDNTTTSRSNAPIIAGENSYEKYQFIRFTGTFNRISQVKVAHTSGSVSNNTTLIGKVTSSYAQPSRSAMSGGSDWSPITNINSGTNLLLSSTGPEGANPTGALVTAGYSQYIVTQLQTQATASAGDTNELRISVQYHEN